MEYTASAIRLIKTEDGHLAHYGIQGQKWGIRRYQNPDGTLTAEGRARYYDSLTDKQKRTYDKMSPKNKERMNRKLAQGKSWTKAVEELNGEARRRGQMVGLAISAAYLYANPFTRPMMKAAGRVVARSGKVLFRAIKNSNVVQRGSLWLKKNAARRSMVKNGAIVMNPNDFSVRDIPFGGYLRK